MAKEYVQLILREDNKFAKNEQYKLEDFIEKTFSHKTRFKTIFKKVDFKEFFKRLFVTRKDLINYFRDLKNFHYQAGYFDAMNDCREGIKELIEKDEFGKKKVKKVKKVKKGKK